MIITRSQLRKLILKEARLLSEGSFASASDAAKSSAVLGYLKEYEAYLPLASRGDAILDYAPIFAVMMNVRNGTGSYDDVHSLTDEFSQEKIKIIERNLEKMSSADLADFIDIGKNYTPPV